MLTVFDDMIADMEPNKKKSYSYGIAFRRQKTQYFTFFFSHFHFS